MRNIEVSLGTENLKAFNEFTAQTNKLMYNPEQNNKEELKEILDELSQGSSEENKLKLEELSDVIQKGEYTEEMKQRDKKLMLLGNYEKSLYKNSKLTTRVRKKLIEKQAIKLGLTKIV